MMKLTAGVGRPNVNMALFNDCNIGEPHITRTIGDDSMTLSDSILGSAETSPLGFITPDAVDSQREGQNLYNVLNVSEVVRRGGLLAPRGRPPANAAPSRNDLTFFDGLKGMITGPTTFNVERMWTNPSNGVFANRTSTILTLATKPELTDTNPSDTFSALFTGDAHDHLPDRTDIRGGDYNHQHFLVMKVPHHGSQHSEDDVFYKAYTADYYLISTNWNSHKHPTYNTIKAILEGCKHKPKPGPTIITTSQVGIPKGIDSTNGLITTAFKKLLSENQATMYCFKKDVSL
jgi:hypothetical protein